MSILDCAEKIHTELDKLRINAPLLRTSISQFIDHTFQILVCHQFVQKNQKEAIELKLNSEITNLLLQIGQVQKSLIKQQKQVIFDFEKIELLLYEKNEYKLLHDCIDFVKGCKIGIQKQTIQDSFNEKCEDAFLCSNSLLIPKNSLQDNRKLQEVIQNINKSSMSLSQKEQLVYNVIKSQTKTQSQLQHVILEDVLNISYQQANKKAETSILSSIQEQINTNKLNQLGDKILLLTNEGFKDCASPKFQFSSLSPIKPIEDGKDKSFKTHHSSVILGSFKNSEVKQQIQQQIPRIKIECLDKEKDETDYKAINKNYESFNNDTSCKQTSSQTKKKKRYPKQLSLFEKQSFYDKSTVLNMISNINRSKETKDTDNRKSDSQKSRERNSTFHSQPQQGKFLKDLMQKVYQKSTNQKKPYKISEFERKQLNLLVGNIRKQNSHHN